MSARSGRQGRRGAGGRDGDRVHRVLTDSETMAAPESSSSGPIGVALPPEAVRYVATKIDWPRPLESACRDHLRADRGRVVAFCPADGDPSCIAAGSLGTGIKRRPGFEPASRSIHGYRAELIDDGCLLTLTRWLHGSMSGDSERLLVLSDLLSHVDDRVTLPAGWATWSLGGSVYRVLPGLLASPPVIESGVGFAGSPSGIVGMLYGVSGGLPMLDRPPATDDLPTLAAGLDAVLVDAFDLEGYVPGAPPSPEALRLTTSAFDVDTAATRFGMRIRSPEAQALGMDQTTRPRRAPRRASRRSAVASGAPYRSATAR